MSMYRGTQRFTKEQMIFMVEVHLNAAIDRIDCATLPLSLSDDEQMAKDRAYIEGAKETAGMGLATIYAQLTDDGMGIHDALEHIKFDDVLENYIQTYTDESPRPDSRKLAEQWVKAVFGEPWFVE